MQNADELSDLLVLYQSSIDEVHRAWNYFSLVGVGMLTVTLTVAGLEWWQYLSVGLMFFVFAAGNAYLVYQAQDARVKAASAIKAYVKLKKEDVASEEAVAFIRAQSSLLETLRPAPVRSVLRTHTGLHVIVLFVIVVKAIGG